MNDSTSARRLFSTPLGIVVNDSAASKNAMPCLDDRSCASILSTLLCACFCRVSSSRVRELDDHVEFIR